MDVPFEKIDIFHIAYDLLQQTIKQLIADQMLDWIIADFTDHWVVDIAKEYGVPLAYFLVFSASTSVFFGSPENFTGANRNYALPSPESLISPPEWVTSPSLLAFKECEAIHVPQGFFGANSTGISGASWLAKIVSASQVLAIRSCNEIEGEYIEVYKKITGKPVIPIGLLPPDQPEKGQSGKSVMKGLNGM